jgi:hypothetical protein
MKADPRASSDDPSIGLDIEGPGVTLARLIQATGHLVRILNAVERSVSGRERVSLDWVITGLRGGSAHIEAAPRPITPNAPIWIGRTVVKRVAEGVESIRRGSGKPRDFPDSAVEDVLGLVKMLDKRGITKVALRANNKPVAITRAIALNDAFATLDRLESEGAIEGRIETMSVHAQNWFNLYDTLTEAAVRCTYTEDLYDKVYAAFNKRALVWGTISRQPDGHAASIRVSDITVLPSDDDLQPIASSFGVLNNG